MELDKLRLLTLKQDNINIYISRTIYDDYDDDDDDGYYDDLYITIIESAIVECVLVV